MISRTQIRSLVFLSLLILPSCINQSPLMGQDQAVDLAWDALEPNTTSGNPDNWEVNEARRVTGREVVSEFVEARFINCPGPLPPENKAIKASSEYWYIKVVPIPATSLPQEEDNPTKSVPQIPEPFIREVLMLVDVFSGQVVARKFTCIIY